MRINEYPLESAPTDSQVAILDGADGTKSVYLSKLREFMQAGSTGSGGSGSVPTAINAYVTASGTSGDWRWRRWSNGIGECWIHKNYGAYSNATSQGGEFYNCVFTWPIAFATATATLRPVMLASGVITGDLGSHVTYCLASENGREGELWVKKSTSVTSGDLLVSVYVVGVLK